MNDIRIGDIVQWKHSISSVNTKPILVLNIKDGWIENEQKNFMHVDYVVVIKTREENRKEKIKNILNNL